MLKLSEFRHNHHPSGVKMLANFTRRGIPVILSYTRIFWGSDPLLENSQFIF